MNAPENVRRGAEGVARRSVLGADGRRDGQINGTENITRARPANRGDVIPRPEPAADRGRGQRAGPPLYLSDSRNTTARDGEK